MSASQSSSVIPDVTELLRVPDPVPEPTHSPKLDNLTDVHTQALIDIRTRLADKQLRTPKVAIVCGSGLSGLSELIQDKVLVNYNDIAGFGQSTGQSRKPTLLARWK